MAKVQVRICGSPRGAIPRGHPARNSVLGEEYERLRRDSALSRYTVLDEYGGGPSSRSPQGSPDGLAAIRRPRPSGILSAINLPDSRSLVVWAIPKLTAPILRPPGADGRARPAGW